MIWLITLAICVLPTRPSKATEGIADQILQASTPMSDTRDLIYQHLMAVQGLPAVMRSELRRQLLVAVLKRYAKELELPSGGKEVTGQGLNEDANDSAMSALLDLIADAESKPHGYDAIQHRAFVLPAKKPTAMTLGEIFAWIDETPNQQHAIGRYQIIPTTLSYLQEGMGLSDKAMFDQKLQDRMALQLIREAGLSEFLSGVMDSEDFMDELAFVWAGLPLKSGLSAYHGINGNHATITREFYERKFSTIFAERAANTSQERND